MSLRLLLIIIFSSPWLFCISCQHKPRRIFASDQINILADHPQWQAAVKKYGLSFNSQRMQAGLPLLDSGFYISNWGGDHIEWMNAGDKWPALQSKAIVWDFHVPLLITETSLFRASNGDMLRIRYSRKNPDAFIEKYDSIGAGQKNDNDSLFNRYYTFFPVKAAAASITKTQFDSILQAWGIGH